MSKVPFTDEQIKLLRDNPYTYNVTPHTLYLTKAFKELFYQEYQEGKLPRNILEDYGYSMNVLGESRIWGIAAVIKKEAKRSEGFSEGTTPKKDSLLNADSPETAIKQLQHEVMYLRNEVEFLKKISSIKHTRK